MHGLLIALAMAAGPKTSKKLIHLEAEAGTLTGVTVAKTRTGFTGKGYVTGFLKAGDKIVLKFKAVGGVYEAFIRYSAPNGEKGYTVKVNGTETSGMFTATTDVFDTASAGKVELKTGSNTFEIDKGWGYFDVDYVELVPAKITTALKKPPLKLCDADATAKTKALYARLVSSYGQKTLSGQYNEEDTSYITRTTKKAPAIFGADFMDYSPSRLAFSPAPKDLTEKAIQRGKRGQIVTMSWHWNAPTDLVNKMIKDADGKDMDANWYKGFYTYATDFDLAKAIDDPNSDNYKLIVRDIDAIAAQLKKFSDADIPVLWRPLHEAEGGWFWWGAKGPDPFIKLWQLVYTQLTTVHKLHNLIWVFTIGNNAAWYPGDAYVDILGVDTYPANHSDTLSATWDSLFKQYDGKKLLAISEFGGVPDIPKMRRFGVEWAYFVSWPGEIKPPGTSVATLKRIYGSSYVKNRTAQ